MPKGNFKTVPSALLETCFSAHGGLTNCETRLLDGSLTSCEAWELT